MSLRSAAVSKPLFVSFWRSEGGSGSVAMSRRGAGCCIAVRLLVTHVPCSCCNSDALTRLNGYATETLEVSGPNSLPWIQTLPAKFASAMLRHTCRFSERNHCTLGGVDSTCVTTGAVLRSDSVDIMPSMPTCASSSSDAFCLSTYFRYRDLACTELVNLRWPLNALGQQPASTVHRQPSTVGYELQHTVCA